MGKYKTARHSFNFEQVVPAQLSFYIVQLNADLLIASFKEYQSLLCKRLIGKYIQNIAVFS